MNRRGFGLVAMLGFCCFLGICMTVSFVYYQKAKDYGVSYSRKTNTVKKYRMENDYSAVSTMYATTMEYDRLKDILKNAAITYIEKNPIETENKVVISLTTMQSKKIIDKIYDSNGNLCNGYVIYYPVSKIYDPYLKCGSYYSSNYLSRLE